MRLARLRADPAAINLATHAPLSVAATGRGGQISDLLSGVYRTRVFPHTRCLTQGAYLIARQYSGVRAFTQHGIADLDD